MMIGRDSELRQLVQLAQSGQTRVAMLAGEPGIGKTRLVQELISALPRDTVVLIGHAEPGSLARPYEVLLDAIDERPEVDAELLAGLTDLDRSQIERLKAGLSIVADLTSEAASVVVFEDLHWADSESAALFEKIAALDAPFPRLLIGTYRPDEVTSRKPVAGLLASLERKYSVSHLRLGRLGVSETAAFIAAAIGQQTTYRVAKALRNRAGGNPFFLEELLRGREGDNLEDLVDQPLPWSLVEVLRRQTDDLDPAHHQILEASAVLGQRVPFDLLAGVTKVDEGELIAALRELVARGVLIEAGEDEFAFRHALVREAIKDQMLGRQRRRLHEAALELLLESGAADPALVAYHAQAAGRYDDMVDAARRGAVLYLSIGSPYQALQLSEMGLGEIPNDPVLLSGAARAAWLVGLLDDAVRYAKSWRANASDVTDRADALYLMVRLAWEADDNAAMLAVTEEIETLIDQLPAGPDKARAMTAVAQSAMFRDDIASSVAWADRAFTLAEQLDLPRIRLAALVEKGSALVAAPDSAYEGWSILAGLVDEAEKLGEWVLAARALNNLVQGIPPAAPVDYEEQLERMRTNAERAGFESLAVAAYFEGRARLAVRAGDLAAAIGALKDGRDHDRGYIRSGRWADFHAVFLAGLSLEAGDLDLAEELIQSLLALPRNPTTAILGLVFHLACRRNDIDAAQRGLADLLAAFAEQTWRSGSQAHDLVSAALNVGLPPARLDEMGRVLLGADVWDAYRTLVEAQLAEVRGDHQVALGGYLSVVDSPVPPPSVRGTAHVGAARCLLASDRRATATEHAARAAALLAEWSGWRLVELERLQAQLGLAPAGAAPAITGPAALTPREREVALLIADGLTNVDLARRLYISPKTAAIHVSNILRKLGVPSRTEVASIVNRR